VRGVRLITVFLVAFGATLLMGVAAARTVPAWVKVAADLPALIARSLGL
jgi:hypothetical protein